MAEGRVVLVVEDEADLRQVTAAVLALDGYCVATAADGAAALAAVAGQWPAVLVADVRMPGMSGIELLERLRLDYGRVPPTVLVTAYGLAHETAGLTAAAQALVAPSAVRVVTKPYLLADLEAAVAAVLAEKAQGDPHG